MKPEIAAVLEVIKDALPGMEYSVDASGVVTIKLDDAGSQMLESLATQPDIPWLVEVLKHIRIIRTRVRPQGKK